MAQKKQTSETEGTAAPKKQPATAPKTGTAKNPTTEKAALPAATDAATDAPKPTAKKTTAKAQKPAETSTNGTAAAKATASEAAAAVKIFGEVNASGKTFFIQKGSIPEGQLQLVIDKDKKQLADRIPGYNGQFVTVLGEYGKQKKTDKVPSFVVHNLTSHDEIARRAFELSHDNPSTVEDNWFRAENELLNG